MAHVGAYSFEHARPQRVAFSKLDRQGQGGQGQGQKPQQPKVGKWRTVHGRFGSLLRRQRLLGFRSLRLQGVGRLDATFVPTELDLSRRSSVLFQGMPMPEMLESAFSGVDVDDDGLVL